MTTWTKKETEALEALINDPELRAELRKVLKGKPTGKRLLSEALQKAAQRSDGSTGAHHTLNMPTDKPGKRTGYGISRVTSTPIQDRLEETWLQDRIDDADLADADLPHALGYIPPSAWHELGFPKPKGDDSE